MEILCLNSTILLGKRGNMCFIMIWKGVQSYICAQFTNAVPYFRYRSNPNWTTKYAKQLNNTTLVSNLKSLFQRLFYTKNDHIMRVFNNGTLVFNSSSSSLYCYICLPDNTLWCHETHRRLWRTSWQEHWCGAWKILKRSGIITMTSWWERWRYKSPASRLFTLYLDAYQIKHQSSGSLSFVRGIHRWPSQTASNTKLFPFDDVIMIFARIAGCHHVWFSGLVYNMNLFWYIAKIESTTEMSNRVVANHAL